MRTSPGIFHLTNYLGCLSDELIASMTEYELIACTGLYYYYSRTFSDLSNVPIKFHLTFLETAFFYKGNICESRLSLAIGILQKILINRTASQCLAIRQLAMKQTPTITTEKIKCKKKMLKMKLSSAYLKIVFSLSRLTIDKDFIRTYSGCGIA